MSSRVAVLKTAPETVIEDYGRLMQLAGYREHLPQDRSTHLNMDIPWDLWFPASSTAPWQLEGVIRTLLDDGYDSDSLLLVDKGAAAAGGGAGLVNNGLAMVAERYGIPSARIHEQASRWQRIDPPPGMLVLDRVHGDGIYVPDGFPGTNIIHLPTVKTDAATVTAGAMRNAFTSLLEAEGCLDGGVIHEALVDLLAIQQQVHSGLFAVMDGTICGDGQGPRALEPFEKDFILAGADQVAVDAVAAKMMGFDPMDIRYICLAHERGLGCGVVDDIEIAGEDISSVNFHFRGNGESRGGGFLRPARLPGKAAGLYDEYFWYPFVGWPRVCLMAETRWGQLLQDYLPSGAELESQGRSRTVLLGVGAAAALLGMGVFSRVARMARGRG